MNSSAYSSFDGIEFYNQITKCLATRLDLKMDRKQVPGAENFGKKPVKPLLTEKIIRERFLAKCAQREKDKQQQQTKPEPQPQQKNALNFKVVQGAGATASRKRKKPDPSYLNLPPDFFRTLKVPDNSFFRMINGTTLPKQPRIDNQSVTSDNITINTLFSQNFKPQQASTPIEAPAKPASKEGEMTFFDMLREDEHVLKLAKDATEEYRKSLNSNGNKSVFKIPKAPPPPPPLIKPQFSRLLPTIQEKLPQAPTDDDQALKVSKCIQTSFKEFELSSQRQPTTKSAPFAFKVKPDPVAFILNERNKVDTSKPKKRETPKTQFQNLIASAAAKWNSASFSGVPNPSTAIQKRIIQIFDIATQSPRPSLLSSQSNYSLETPIILSQNPANPVFYGVKQNKRHAKDQPTAAAKKRKFDALVHLKDAATTFTPPANPASVFYGIRQNKKNANNQPTAAAPAKKHKFDALRDLITEHNSQSKMDAPPQKVMPFRPPPPPPKVKVQNCPPFQFAGQNYVRRNRDEGDYTRMLFDDTISSFADFKIDDDGEEESLESLFGSPTQFISQGRSADNMAQQQEFYLQTPHIQRPQQFDRSNIDTVLLFGPSPDRRDNNKRKSRSNRQQRTFDDVLKRNAAFRPRKNFFDDSTDAFRFEWNKVSNEPEEFSFNFDF